jgi:hypothetical protein
MSIAARGSTFLLIRRDPATHLERGMHAIGGGTNARTGNAETRAARQAPGESREHAGGRVRPRRDAPHPRRQTRRKIHQAGNCDWPVESSTLGCEAWAAPGKRKTQHEAQRSLGEPRGQPRAKTSVGQTLARRLRRAQARRSRRGVPQGTLATGKDRGTPALGDFATSGSPTGGTDASATPAHVAPPSRQRLLTVPIRGREFYRSGVRPRPFCAARRRCRIRFARSSSRRRVADSCEPARLMK